MLEGEQRWDDAISGLVKWIRKLPLPIGIFAVSDARARMIADACEIVGRKVPEQVGIIGVDNNHFDCELGSPQLTTIECDWWRVGYQAAELLDRLMSETTTKLIEQLIPPTGVIERESTDVTIVDHPAVAKAVAFAKAHQGQCFGVKALVTAAGVSRRYLETSFARALHRTPAQYLAEMRVQRAKSLLSLKSMSLSRIAKESGFSDLRQFRRVFTRLQKRSPSAHRKSLTRPARPITGHT
jgi:LacI family transcriptional regulator